MKRVLIGIILVLSAILVFKTCTQSKDDKAILEENSMLIQEQIKNTSKLIVTEGFFAEVYNYKDSQELFGPLITADKKALVVVNAEVNIVYDLSKIDFRIDQENKTLYINSIPEPEIKINPDFEYYDVTADYLNPFKAADYNKIKKNVRASLIKKVKTSTLISNADNRLISELTNYFILTNSMGWNLIYLEELVKSTSQLKLLENTLSTPLLIE